MDAPLAVSPAASNLLHLAFGPLLAQFELLDLAGSRQRHGLNDEPVARGLVRCEMLAHVIVQLVLVEDHARRRPNKRRYDFAPSLIRQSDDGDVADLGMAEQQLLELARIDVFATANDHILQSSLDRAVAPCIHRSEIAGVQPALGINGSPGGGFILEVTVHDVIATRAYLTDLADRNGLSGFRVDDLHLDDRQRSWPAPSNRRNKSP